ncbi:phosphoribosylamine--glycine ligase [Paenibacillus sp. ACRRX]|uniref:phosphoribosylamine--glycine ligase n=1 Tax=unclassified Paenibacillus TaxID=185978 RepID=UPI001EF50CBF|nr:MULTISPECIES: phosphoribosylamine--glycine ligase [unclassified Paenibacillus]MCG7409539.1 phosphoribosylamine--glycine ligase [Paenibacillus sp. ACRRX]MDK8183389.1 phosphoribosylamine--glycine ligase [Paenibacillus sp. UMB4589-SE434]
MKVMVIGGGGREHALVWSLRQSSKVSEVVCAPGNAGIAELATCVPLAVNEFEAIANYAKEHEIDLIVVGPDDPLADGIVDVLQSYGLKVFGPNKAAAEIEGSKVFMKHLLRKYNIPTAAYETFDDVELALRYVRSQPLPTVIKADGLAAGKGVIIAHTLAEAEAALQETMVDKKFGKSGNRIVIEEFMRGQEISILAFVDGETVRACVPAQDHKPIFDGDQGPNTGGMGTYSPVPHIDASVVEEALKTIIEPTAKAMVEEGRTFKGLLFAGLMITPEGQPKVVEFNARFGDPETQVVLPRLKTDIVEVFEAVVNGTLHEIQLEWSDDAAVCVIVASGGYPGTYRKGDVITGLANAEQKALVFHAGTASNEAGDIVTSGGRVLGIVGRGSDVKAAQAAAYEAVKLISFDGMYYRTDIAGKALTGALV